MIPYERRQSWENLIFDWLRTWRVFQTNHSEEKQHQFSLDLVPPQKSSKLIVSQVRAIPEHFDHFIGLALLRSIIS